ARLAARRERQHERRGSEPRSWTHLPRSAAAPTVAIAPADVRGATCAAALRDVSRQEPDRVVTPAELSCSCNERRSTSAHSPAARPRRPPGPCAVLFTACILRAPARLAHVRHSARAGAMRAWRGTRRFERPTARAYHESTRSGWRHDRAGWP